MWSTSHFILVHGSCHGAWCWYKLDTLLKQAGYRVTTPDMAASGIDPRQAEDLKSVSEYSQPLMDLLALLPSNEQVILVGHSFGGLVLTQAMERFPHKISVARSFPLCFHVWSRPQLCHTLEHEADTVVSKEKYRSVRRVYVVNEEDKLFKKDFQLYMIKNNPTNEVKELKGSDHMAMFSNPKELFSILQDIAKSYT